MAIQYAPKSWNPVSGCSHVSEGCAHCWAERMARRRHQEWGHVEIPTNPKVLTAPLAWRDPLVVATAFMGDLFHPDVPDSHLLAVFAVMLAAERHTFLLLTKRPERMRDWLVGPPALAGWPGAYSNVWIGVSVENQARADERVPILLGTPGHHWLSCEPQLGPIDLSRYLPNPLHRLTGRPMLDWIVVGGESGLDGRPFDPEVWARVIRDQSATAGVPFYMKQMGTWWAKHEGVREVDFAGRNMEYWPPDLRVRQLPEALMAKGGTMPKGRRADGKEP